MVFVRLFFVQHDAAHAALRTVAVDIKSRGRCKSKRNVPVTPHEVVLVIMSDEYRQHFPTLRIQAAVELFYERQFRQLEEDAARQRAAARLAESARESPQNALCAPFAEEASPSAEPGLETEFDPLSGVFPGTKEKAG